MLANQNVRVYNSKSYLTVGELASSPMEGIEPVVNSIVSFTYLSGSESHSPISEGVLELTVISC